MGAQALDAWLDRQHARVTQQLDLVLREVGLGLVEQRQAELPLAESRQQVAEVAHVEDVVDGHHVPRRIAPPELVELGHHPIRALAAEVHRRAVQAAERAVRLGSPPAAPRRLDQQRRVQHGHERAAAHGGEVVVVVGRWHTVQIGERLGGAVRRRAAVAAIDDTGDASSVLPRRDRLDEAREAVLAFARADVVDPGKAAMELASHLPLAVSPAEHDDLLRPGLLDEAGQGERGEVLLEGRREPDDVVVGDADTLRGTPAGTVRCAPARPGSASCSCGPTLAFRVSMYTGEIELVAEQVLREQPVASEQGVADPSRRGCCRCPSPRARRSAGSHTRDRSGCPGARAPPSGC